MNAFERKIFWWIYSPIIDNGEHRKLTNHEIYQLYTKKPIIKAYFKNKKLEWAGYVSRSESIVNKMFIERLYRKSFRGYLRQRWAERVVRSCQNLARIKNKRQQRQW